MHKCSGPQNFVLKVSLKTFVLLSPDATIYVGGLDDKVSETLMWELFVQSGPVGKILLILSRAWFKFANLRDK